MRKSTAEEFKVNKFLIVFKLKSLVLNRSVQKTKRLYFLVISSESCDFRVKKSSEIYVTIMAL